MRDRIGHVAILIPARNEEDLLPRCLRSVQVARALLSKDVTSDVIVACDCCIDGTQRAAEALLGPTCAVVVTDAGQVGNARALATKIALERYKGPPERCWLANTDADCAVPPDWLLRQLAMAQGGVEAVAGIVEVDSFAEHHPKVKELFRLSYTIRPDGTHPHVHGANIGVRADAYLNTGGWMEMPTAEDHDLWGRLERGGHERLSDATLRVLTSGRRIGRAPLGFAGALAAHNGSLA